MTKIFVLTIALVISCSAIAVAADQAVSAATLGAMGIGQMQPLSDEDGLAVRGKGTFANVWGFSQARWGGQSSSNNYSAGSSWLGQSSSALGGSLSFGGKAQLGFGHFGW